jgi:hypothetical protein
MDFRCSHCDSSQQPMTSEQEREFIGGRLPDGSDVFVCKACFDEFKKNSQIQKYWDWGGRISVIRVTKPSPISKQPLDDMFS